MIPPILIMIRGPWSFLGGRVPAPVIILWPVLLLILVLGLAVLPFVRIKGTTARQRFLMPWLLWRMLGALRGLEVDVDAEGTRVQIRCW